MGLTRRRLLAALGSVFLGRIAHGADLGDIGRREPSIPIGLQLFTVRKSMAESIPRTLQIVAEVGYREVEFAGYFGQAPAEIRAHLAKAGLAAPGALLPYESFERDFDGALDAAVAIGHRYLTLAWLPPEDRTGHRFRQIAEVLNRSGERARQAGVQVAYHNHDFEFVSAGGESLYDILSAETDPALVKLELDLYWLAVARRNPLDIIRKFPGRILGVHVKDMDDRGNITDVGSGIIDFRSVYALREQAGIRHFFIEHDDPVVAETSIRNSFRGFSKIIDGL